MVLALVISGAIALVRCNHAATDAKAASPYQNLNDTVHYVGINTCKTCHLNVYETFIKTGMGQSFGAATKQKSAATYDSHSLVYDTANNYYYYPFWQGDSLYIREFRLAGKDTVHNRVEHVSYVIGSGQHTNSHLVDFNGFITQAPITFYTQKGEWDMAPGFAGGFSSRFDRIIGHECMTCHNAMPGFVKGSENKYDAVPLGIDCERCHGPGSLHVKEKLAGHFVDTSKMADYTIVNPKRLGKDLQMSLCQRCHLQGIAVLDSGKHFDDFRPGMELCDVMNVYLPRFENADNDFIMASQADRLRMSECYKKSGMTCLTCHNPHVSVKFTPAQQFNNACVSCHSGVAKATSSLVCSEDEAKRQAVNNNCISCHMPKSGSIDIPHVNITDHYIRKHYEASNHLSVEQVQGIKRFIGLKCMTKDNPTDIELANGYLHFYESYSHRDYLLDSVQMLLQRKPYTAAQFNSWVHLYFLKEDYQKVAGYAAKSDTAKVNDDWTLYRVGEAYMQLGDPATALKWYTKAAKISPYDLDFLNKQASALYGTKNIAEAQKVYERIVQINPHFVPALTSLGFIYMTENKTAEAGKLLDQAIALNPDHQMALLNRAELYFYTAEYDKSRDLTFKVLKKDPGNERGRALLKQLVGKTQLL